MGPDLLTVPWREENLEWKEHDPKTPALSSSKSELIRMKRKTGLINILGTVKF